MVRKSLLTILLAGVSIVSYAQVPSHPKYVSLRGPEGGFADAYRKWVPGQPISPELADDEEFFISRVKLKERFTNANTQVDVNQSPDRRFFWWVPIGQQEWNALPTYFFNSEVFNMWSYVDSWGNWTAQLLRAPAAYLDICHKNGVTTQVVASVPFGETINENQEPHGKNMAALVDMGYENYLKFLRYYGVDGIGYNSEFNFNSADLMRGLQDLVANASNHSADYGIPQTEFAWYSITANSGRMPGTYYWNSLNSINDNWFYNTRVGGKVSNYFFCNYNWADRELKESVATAEKYAESGASSYDVYAGMDMQGRDYTNWLDLQNYPISIGIWGAHNMNMLFESRNENGSSGDDCMNTYMERSELFFTGGSKNPVNTPAVADVLYYSTGSAKAFHGISSFITARSVLQSDDLSKEPFVTYFNLGNGKFFNVRGETTFSKEWYNIGIQDYLPTWRWWFTSKFMGREATDVPVSGLSAGFTWDDAWFGGSCMKISGTTDSEYLQLFKTRYPLQEGDVLTVRYKSLGGSGNMALACSAEGAETSEISVPVKTAGGENGVWVEKQIRIGAGAGELNMAGKTLAMIGLHFTDAENMQLLIGEMSLTRGWSPAPKRPMVKKSSVLGYNYQGADVKVIYSMDEEGSKANAWETTYNSDVDTWYFKIYVQEKGGDPVMCTATTSWAAYVIGAPVSSDGREVRVGVSAVSLDGRSESEIAWSDYMALPEPTVTEGIAVDKSIVKSGEQFTVSYIDPNHSEAVKWVIKDGMAGDDSTPLVVADGGMSMTASLDEIGIYDLALTHQVNGRDTTEIHRGLIQITAPEVGAVPEIEDIALNGGKDEIQMNRNGVVTFSYVGREADGKVSRGLVVPDVAFTIPTAQLGFTISQPYSIAYWFKFNAIEMGSEGIGLLNIRNPGDGWPASNWGHLWMTLNKKCAVSVSIRAASDNHLAISDPSFTFEAGRWYHMCVVMDYDASKGRILTLYVNGRKLASGQSKDLYAWTDDNMLMFGGYQANRGTFNGVIDEFQLYDKALSEEEAYATMEHKAEIPEGLIGYWDFESEAESDNSLISTGEKPLVAYLGGSEDSDGTDGTGSAKHGAVAFDAGTPFLSGLYEVTTVPEWDFGNYYEILDETGGGTEGSAIVKYTRGGDYFATITLKNSWGSDRASFPFVRVSKSVQDGRADDGAVYPNPFVDELNINFSESGIYAVRVLSVTGSLVAEQVVTAVSGEFVRLRIDAAPGAYVVKIYNEDGDAVRAVKVLKK